MDPSPSTNLKFYEAIVMPTAIIWFAVVCLITQSVDRLKNKADTTALSPASCHAESGFAVSYHAYEVVKAFVDEDNLLWYSICPEDMTTTVLMDTVKGFFQSPWR